MTVEQLYSHLEKHLSRALSADWDNDGIACLPHKNQPVAKVLIALDATEQAVDSAIEGGFDVLLTHHPLLFRGVKELTPAQTVPRKLLRLAQNGVAALSFHTRLDAAKGGVNDVLADLLGLYDVDYFAPDGEVPCGRIGTLPEPMDAAEFADMVCEKLNIPAVTLAGRGEIRTVAVLGGEGGDFVDAAIETGADAFLSGRIGYHRMLDAAEEGLILVEAGHYATEFPVCEMLAELVREIAPMLEIEILDAPTIRTVVR